MFIEVIYLVYLVYFVYLVLFQQHLHQSQQSFLKTHATTQNTWKAKMIEVSKRNILCIVDLCGPG